MGELDISIHFGKAGCKWQDRGAVSGNAGREGVPQEVSWAGPSTRILALGCPLGCLNLVMFHTEFIIFLPSPPLPFPPLWPPPLSHFLPSSPQCTLASCGPYPKGCHWPHKLKHNPSCPSLKTHYTVTQTISRCQYMLPYLFPTRSWDFRDHFILDSNLKVEHMLGTSEALDKNFVKDPSLWRMICEHTKTPLSLPIPWSQARWCLYQPKVFKIESQNNITAALNYPMRVDCITLILSLCYCNTTVWCLSVEVSIVMPMTSLNPFDVHFHALCVILRDDVNAQRGGIGMMVVLGWPKSSSGFLLKMLQKTWMTFWANTLLGSQELRVHVPYLPLTPPVTLGKVTGTSLWM